MHSVIASCLSFIIAVILLKTVKSSADNKYGKGFLNHTGCLYTYMEGGTFQFTTASGNIIQERLELDSLTFDTSKTRCITDKEPGKIVFTFETNETTKIRSITIGMRIVASEFEGTWEISQANLTTRTSSGKRIFPLRVDDVYASSSHSYSCNEFKLQTSQRKKFENDTGKIDPKAIITLERFQLQPFAELKNVVFAPSFDCATFISVPGLTGLCLILFLAFITISGVIFLQRIETNDFKYSKEGLQFTHSQMEYNKQK